MKSLCASSPGISKTSNAGPKSNGVPRPTEGEFSCIAEGRGNGGRWARQAQYLFEFDASTFAEMTKSVESALASTPGS